MMDVDIMPEILKLADAELELLKEILHLIVFASEKSINNQNKKIGLMNTKEFFKQENSWKITSQVVPDNLDVKAWNKYCKTYNFPCAISQIGDSKVFLIPKSKECNFAMAISQFMKGEIQKQDNVPVQSINYDGVSYEIPNGNVIRKVYESVREAEKEEIKITKKSLYSLFKEPDAFQLDNNTIKDIIDNIDFSKSNADIRMQLANGIKDNVKGEFLTLNNNKFICYISNNGSAATIDFDKRKVVHANYRNTLNHKTKEKISNVFKRIRDKQMQFKEENLDNKGFSEHKIETLTKLHETTIGFENENNLAFNVLNHILNKETHKADLSAEAEALITMLYAGTYDKAMKNMSLDDIYATGYVLQNDISLERVQGFSAIQKVVLADVIANNREITNDGINILAEQINKKIYGSTLKKREDNPENQNKKMSMKDVEAMIERKKREAGVSTSKNNQKINTHSR